MIRPPPLSISTTQTMESQSSSVASVVDPQNQLIQKFSQQSGMNIEYSKMFVCLLLLFFQYLFCIIYIISSCLSENDWNYDKAAQKFQECQRMVCFS